MLNDAAINVCQAIGIGRDCSDGGGHGGRRRGRGDGSVDGSGGSGDSDGMAGGRGLHSFTSELNLSNSMTRS